MKQSSVMQRVRCMENKPYQLRYLPIFEQDLISTANYITNVLKNEDAALRLIDDVESLLSNLCEELCCLLCGDWRCDGGSAPDIWCKGYRQPLITNTGSRAVSL